MADISPQKINVRDGAQHVTTDGCFQTSEPLFAMPKHGNKVTPLTNGKELFAEIAKAIAGAKQFILFTDWQMDYDVELHQRGSKSFEGRFTELLAKKVAEGVEVKALLYDSIEAAVYTHENEVRSNLMRLNPKASEFGQGAAPRRNPAGNLPVEVALQHPVTGRSIENVLFSHHQKSIVIDGRIAFVGGMDVTYGRWCDNNFDVVADPVKHRINDMYNPCISPGRRTTVEEQKITGPYAGVANPAKSGYGLPRPGFATPYYMIGVLSRRVQDMLERGYTVQQMEDLIQLMQIDDQIRDYFAQKSRELNALLTAIQRTLNRYADAKAEAGRQLLAGNILQGVKGSVGADIELTRVALRKVGDALDYIASSVRDYVASKLNDFGDWFDKSMTDLKADIDQIDEYRKNPNLMVSDAKRLFADLLDLPSQLIDDFVLEEGCQPRMPWQDVHCKVEGPAAHDVFANFVRRWNVAVTENRDNTAKGVDPETGLDWRVKPLGQSWLARWGDADAVFGNMQQHGTQGNVSVQVVRSAARQLLQREQAHAGLLPLPNLLGKTGGKPTAGLANNTVAGEGQMDGVLEAMIHAIRGADAYIYIETQFFISECEQSDNFEKAIATNPLAEELANRIGLAVQRGKSFHVYVVLPVHPEGNIQDGGVAKQQYWALQSIKRGRRSLVRRVCEKIAIKKHQVKPGDKPRPADVNALVESGAWRDYLTFLNLRNWGMTTLFSRDKTTRQREDRTKPLGRFVITEQIYVHSKLMIVDDAIAIIGSANCNDRSLNGNGDTEIATVVVDNDIQKLDLGNGTIVNTRKFARELRIQLWKKHLGLSIKDADYTRGDRVLDEANSAGAKHPGTPLAYPPRTQAQSAAKAAGVVLAKPASPGTWKAIQAIAKSNASLYESVFQHTPRNSMKYFADTQTGWPKRLSRAVLAAMFVQKMAIPVVQKKAEAMAKQDKLITDFSTLPPQLTDRYMVAGKGAENLPYKDVNVGKPRMVHDVEAARSALGGLTGFWVEMPLDFGIQERDAWLQGRLGNTAVARNEVPAHRDEAGAEPAVLTASTARQEEQIG